MFQISSKRVAITLALIMIASIALAACAPNITADTVQKCLKEGRNSTIEVDGYTVDCDAVLDQAEASATALAGGPATPTLATENCGQNGRNEDEINVSGYGAPCGTMPLNTFLAIMNAAKGSEPYQYINQLDRAFEGDINTGYQFRNVIPATIPSAKHAQRVMWGSLDWIRDLPADQQTIVESRILRLRCDGNNPCIYLLTDGDTFEVGWPGRGILLSEPLNPERDFPTWWGK